MPNDDAAKNMPARLSVVLSVLIFGTTIGAADVSAAITNWQTGQVIPGTELLTPAPGVTIDATGARRVLTTHGYADVLARACAERGLESGVVDARLGTEEA